MTMMQSMCSARVFVIASQMSQIAIPFVPTFAVDELCRRAGDSEYDSEYEREEEMTRQVSRVVTLT